jgi:hypothetical protein
VYPHGFVARQRHCGTIFGSAENRERGDGEKNKHDQNPLALTVER